MAIEKKKYMHLVCSSSEELSFANSKKDFYDSKGLVNYKPEDPTIITGKHHIIFPDWLAMFSLWGSWNYHMRNRARIKSLEYGLNIDFSSYKIRHNGSSRCMYLASIDSNHFVWSSSDEWRPMATLCLNIDFKTIVKDPVTLDFSMRGKRYKHTNGNIYAIVFLTNVHGDASSQKKHPIDVVYIGPNGALWSRPLSDWDRSFTEVVIDK